MYDKYKYINIKININTVIFEMKVKVSKYNKNIILRCFNVNVNIILLMR